MKTYLSVCSGIESATVAWHPLGWRPWAYAEIEPFPSYVLNHHYGSGRPHFMPDPDEAGLPDDDRKERRAARKAVAGLSLSPVGGNSVPNLGDMTQFKEWPDADIDVLVGGTPCQSYSVAGLGKGLDDPRGDLMLTYVAIARRYRPAWVVWENVPGVLSNDGGRAFGTLLGLLTGKRVEVPAGGWQTAGAIEGYKSAYGIAWRILDSQFVRVDGFGRAVPQRRRRVFVVGYLGDWRRAAAVLFERAGMSGDPAPRRKAGEKIAGTISSRPAGSGGLGTDFDLDGGLTVAHTLSAARGAAAANMADLETYLPVVLTLSESSGHARPGDNIQSSDYLIPVGQSYVPDIVPQALTSEAGETGKGDSAQCVAFGIRSDASRLGEAKTPSADAEGRVRLRDPGLGIYEEIAPTVDAGQAHTVATAWAVRRLTPVECERLQAMPDGYTNVPWRGADEAPDGPRYKALGNSMSANVMRWIGMRIDMVDAIFAK